MTQFVLIIFGVILVTIYSAAELTCKPSETIDNCPAKCSAGDCPKSENYVRTCPTPDKCPQPACKCRFNYRRAENGTCIPTRDCPSFDCSARPNEEYNACPSYCPTDNCSQATPDGHCPLPGHILLVVQCFPTCRCIEGYWRNDGICVPYDQCPGKGDNKTENNEQL